MKIGDLVVLKEYFHKFGKHYLLIDVFTTPPTYSLTAYLKERNIAVALAFQHEYVYLLTESGQGWIYTDWITLLK